MKLMKSFVRALVLGLAATMLLGAAPGKAVKAEIAFSTGDLFGANATSRKCVKFGKAGYIYKVVCNCYTGTTDLTVLDADVSVFPVATATQQATPLGIATGCTSMIIINVDSTFISETGSVNYGELCIQATAIGGPAAVNCKFRGTAGEMGIP